MQSKKKEDKIENEWMLNEHGLNRKLRDQYVGNILSFWVIEREWMNSKLQNSYMEEEEQMGQEEG